MCSKTAKSAKKTVAIFIAIFDDFNLLDVAGPTQVFTQANDVASNSSIEYQVSVVSKAGGLVRSNSGLALDSRRLDEVRVEKATLLVAGGVGVHEAIKDDELVEWFSEISLLEKNRIGSVCTGAFLLAQAGVLDGKKAVTHWRSVQQLQTDYAAVKVECDPIYICDQGIWTSAGISAGIDLGLAMVAEDLGHLSSLETARELVVYLKRSGGQSQFSSLLQSQMKDRNELFYELHCWIENNLNSDLSIENLADRMNMSMRTFYRLYKKENGKTPAKNIEKIRIESAKGKLENTILSLRNIADFCGFGNESRFRRAFISQVGISPSEYRVRFKR